MSQTNSTVLDYLRHGEPVGGSRFRGHGVDDPLSEKGWQQMRATAAAIDGWQRIVSSPMRRCVDFARWLSSERGLPLEVDPDLKEVGFGSWEGALRDQLRLQRRAEYDAFYADPVRCRPAGAEPLEVFAMRVAGVFDRLLASYPAQHTLVVCHAGVIRATLGHVIQAPPVNWYRTEVDNAALTRFAGGQHGPRLVAHNWRPSL
ncbi:MAG: histidine phosphatase family protein [Chromatiaceae bacterium]|nr:histidine phosphatase family protein [Chromatiaceae bacterium]